MDRQSFQAHRAFADAAQATELQRAKDTIADLRKQLRWEREERANIKHGQLVVGIIIGIVVACIAGNLAGVWS